jgi:hypothetical protein
MSVPPVVAAPGRADLRDERRRILAGMLGDLDALSRRGAVAIRDRIPAYEDVDARFFEDVHDQVRLHYETKLRSFIAARPVTGEDIGFSRSAATRRARAGLALEDYLNAFRVGQQVFWDAVVEHAGPSPAGHDAALELAGPIMRYVDFASTHVAHVYVEFQQYVVADAARERRDLLEHLLTGALPAQGSLLGAAQRFGIGPDTRFLAVRAVEVDPGIGADVRHGVSAAIAHAWPPATTLVVARQTEIVALPVLPAESDPTAACAQLEAIQQRLMIEGVTLAIGVSTVAAGVAELPRAYDEAATALAGVGDDGGVSALTRLSPFEYLAQRADDTARRLVDPRLRAFLADDRERGGVLTATIRAFAAADGNLRTAGEHLQIHPNTAQYRLARIQERSGRNPRCTADLLDLLVAISLE